jgi:uncharacterized membrane protein YfcA
MVPSAAAGIFLGYLLAARVSEVAVLGVVGLISIVFGCYRLWVERKGMEALPAKSRDWMGCCSEWLRASRARSRMPEPRPIRWGFFPRGCRRKSW